MIPEIPKKQVCVRGSQMAYVDRGAGPSMVFLHGNPTSSHLWRNVIGPLSGQFRCVAPDLIGMGDSQKLAPSGPERYGFFEHREFLDGFLEALDLPTPLILVVHDWGSALGFDWTRRHPAQVRGVAYMEAIVGPLTWESFPGPARSLFEALRSPRGEEMVLRDNVFVERVLPGSIKRKLTPEEMDEYRRPFREAGEGRRPTLSWPRELPIDGQPARVTAEVTRYAEFLSRSPLPKLFVNAEPGRVLVGTAREACRRWPNQTEVTVDGLHFIQEDSAPQIAAAIAAWAERLAP